LISGQLTNLIGVMLFGLHVHRCVYQRLCIINFIIIKLSSNNFSHTLFGDPRQSRSSDLLQYKVSRRLF